MAWIALYIILIIAFLLWWKAAHYRTPDEEAQDIEEEAAHWRKRAKQKYIDNFGKKDDTYYG